MIWAVVLLILLLTVVFLTRKATAVIVFDEGVFITVKVAGFTLYRYPRNIGDKVKKNLKRESKQSEGKNGFFGQLKEKHGFIGAIVFILKIVKNTIARLGRVVSRIRIDVLHIDLTVASDDAAKTAIIYGQVCSALYPVVALLDSKNHISDKKVNVSADFGCINPDLKVNIKVHTRAIYLLSAILLFVSDIQKITNSRKDAAK